MPDRLAAIAEIVKGESEKHEERAIRAADLYRSAIWAIYGLTAVAVLSALLAVVEPLFPAEVWAIVEVAVLAGILAIYLVAGKQDWHGEWLRERIRAERLRYLPLSAALFDLGAPDSRADRYVGLPPRTDRQPARPFSFSVEEQAESLLRGAWEDPRFVNQLVAWLKITLQDQVAYHRQRAEEEAVLRHRVHRLTIVLFASTAVAACLHIGVHSVWLTVATASFPAFGASLNGALAQLESLRIGTLSEALVGQLSRLEEEIAHADSAGQSLLIRQLTKEALDKLLNEHEEWHQALRPRKVTLA